MDRLMPGRILFVVFLVNTFVGSFQNERMCNFLNDDNYRWVYRNTAGLFPFKLLKEKYHGTQLALPAKQFHKGSGLIFINEILVFVGSNEFDENKVFEITMQGFSAAYVPYSVYASRLPPEDPFSFEVSAWPTLQDMYLFYYPEQKLQLKFDSVRPRHLFAEAASSLVIWVEDKGVHDTMTLFNVSQGAPVRSWNPSSLDQMHGMIEKCDRYIIFEEYNPLTNSSDVYLAYQATNTLELLTRYSVNSFYPQIDSNLQGASCNAIWLETNGSIVLDNDNDLQMASAGQHVVINLLELPLKVKTFFPPSDWATGPYTLMINVVVSSDFVVLALAREDHSSHMLRYFIVSVKKWHDVLPSKSDTPLNLVSASEGGVLFWKKGDDSSLATAEEAHNRLFLLKLVGVGSEPWHMLVCEVLSWGDSEPVIGAAIFHDTVVWVQNKVNRSGSIFLIDLNKDNDRLFDANDRFPLIGDFFADSDNDGVGDEGDIITAVGPCVTSSNKGECWSDVRILYLVYGVFMIIFIWTAFIGHRWRTKFDNVSIFLSKNAESSEFFKWRDITPPHLDVPPSPCHQQGAIVPPTQVPFASQMASQLDTKSHWLSGDKMKQTGFVEMAVKRVRKRRQFVRRMLSDAFDLLIVVLATISLLLVLLPFYEQDETIGKMSAFMWVDWFVSGAFIVDVCGRVIVLDRLEYSSRLNFCIRNWFEFPSLMCDVPGLTGVVSYFNPWAAPIDRIFRVLRILRAVRLVRMYYRITRNHLVFPIISDQPFRFLLTFMAILILLSAMAIKTHEQYTVDPQFDDFASVLWYVLVTVATVGYGDMYATTVYGRLVSVFVASLGIGLLGMLSAKMVQKILAAESTSHSLHTRKVGVQQRRKVERRQIEKMAAYINPMNAVLKGVCIAEDDGLLKNAMEVRSWRHVQLSENSMSLPVEELNLDGGGGKFQQKNMQKNSVGHDHNMRIRKQVAVLGGHGVITSSTALRLVLRANGIYEGPGSKRLRGPFADMWNELFMLIYEPPLMYETSMERTMCIMRHKRMLETPPTQECYTTADPWVLKQQKVDRTLAVYGIAEFPEWHSIRDQVRILVLQQDRLNNARWAVSNLEYRLDVKPPPPVTSLNFVANRDLSRRIMGVTGAKKLLQNSVMAAHRRIMKVQGSITSSVSLLPESQRNSDSESGSDDEEEEYTTRIA